MKAWATLFYPPCSISNSGRRKGFRLTGKLAIVEHTSLGSLEGGGWYGGVAAMEVKVAGRETRLLEVLSEDEEVLVSEPSLGVKASDGFEVL
jgi:hypothetical protein